MSQEFYSIREANLCENHRFVSIFKEKLCDQDAFVEIEAGVSKTFPRHENA